MRRLARLGGLTLLLCAVGTAARAQEPASEQPTETAGADPEAQRTAIARALFEEGLSLADRGQWARAADRFRRAAAVRASPPVRFNLAQSLARLGRLVEAIEMLHEVEDDRAAAPDVRASAAALRRRLEPRLARLTIEVDGNAADARVRLDRLELPAEALGVRLPVDPGRHVVALFDEDDEIAREEIDVGEGMQRAVRLRSPGAVASGGSVLGEPWFWAMVGVVVASAAVGAFIVLGANDDAGAASGALVDARL